MNEHPLGDPQLQSLEARLAAMVPHVSPAEQQRLLYQCAFAAGRQAGRQSLRRWQVLAAALVALLLGLSIPVARDQGPLAEQTAEPPAPAEVAFPPTRDREEMSVAARQAAPVELDAWQIERSDGASLAEQLAQFERIDPHLRSLAVGVLPRAFLEP